MWRVLFFMCDWEPLWSSTDWKVGSLILKAEVSLMLCHQVGTCLNGYCAQWHMSPCVACDTVWEELWASQTRKVLYENQSVYSDFIEKLKVQKELTLQHHYCYHYYHYCHYHYCCCYYVHLPLLSTIPPSSASSNTTDGISKTWSLREHRLPTSPFPPECCSSADKITCCLFYCRSSPKINQLEPWCTQHTVEISERYIHVLASYCANSTLAEK